jgi:CRISPR system Cascade subunit CasA
MNLTTDAWIPALDAGGRRDLFSLRDLFAHAHELRDLSAKPHERVGLMRLLLCITQAALDGPVDEGEWESCLPTIQPRVHDYLEEWRAAFELFGDGRRFQQVPGLKAGKDSDDGNAATKLDLTLATGNNSTLFDNLAAEERGIEAARIALSLLAFQSFAPCGRIGVAKWNGVDTPGKGSCSHAPCAPSSMIHTVILGENLLQTVHRNLLTKEIVADAYGPDRWGKPSWEIPCGDSGDKAAQTNATMTYLGRLVPLSRAIHLHEGGLSLILANGLEYPIFPAFREATATITKRKDELALLPASTSRSLWRQLPAISVKRRGDADPTSGPLALSHVSDNAHTILWVGALVTDKAKIEDVVESTYSLPAGMFTEVGRVAYERGVSHAEEREGALIQAVKTYAAHLKVGTPASARARQHFWTRVEQHLGELFALANKPDLADNLAASEWGKAVAEAAVDAYERSCPRQTPRQIEAHAHGLRKLTHRPKTDQTTSSKSHE